MPEKWFIEFLGGSIIAFAFLTMVLNFLKRFFPQKAGTCPVEIAGVMEALADNQTKISDNQIKMTEILSSLNSYAKSNDIKLSNIQTDVAVLKDRRQK